VDTYLDIFAYEPTAEDRYYSKYLSKFRNRTLYNYQVSAAISIALNLFGQLDLSLLIEPVTEGYLEAASKLRRLQIDACILADDTGLGKTITLLEALVFIALFIVHYGKTGKRIYRPVILVVAPLTFDY